MTARIGTSPPCKCETIAARVAGPNAAARPSGSQVPVIDIDIDKNGASADRVDAEEVAAIVVSGHHHFVARTDLERSQRQLDRECSAAAGQHMLDAMHLGQSLFQSRERARPDSGPRSHRGTPRAWLRGWLRR